MSHPVWVNGALGGSIDPLDRGLTLGDGIFDTLVAFRRIPFAAARHLARLTSQAEAIGIKLDSARVRAGWDSVLAAADVDHIILRTTVTRGRAERGLWPVAAPEPSLIVSATPWSRRLFGQDVRLATSAISRNAASPASRLKTLSYIDNILAAREAAEKGADDALLLGRSGRVACTTIANVFAIQADLLLTPPLADGVQPGIMRGLVLEAAGAAGLRATERSLRPNDLAQADAVFLTNSVRFLSPVVSLDGALLADRGQARVAALVAAISAAVLQECGIDPRGAE